MWRLAVSALFLVGCTTDAASAPVMGNTLVVGIRRDVPLEGRIDRVQLSVLDDEGRVLFDESVMPAFPAEVPLPELPPGARVSVVAEAMDAAAPDRLLLRQTVELDVPNRSDRRLVPISLNDECVDGVTGRDVSCPDGTCVAGLCVSPFVPTFSLPPYSEDWSEPSSSPCPGSALEVAMGAASMPGEGLPDGSLLVPEIGNQGGSHVFISVQALGLRTDGVFTLATFVTLDGPDEGATPPQRFISSYEVSGDGCVLDPVRYILSDEGEDHEGEMDMESDDEMESDTTEG